MRIVNPRITFGCTVSVSVLQERKSEEIIWQQATNPTENHPDRRLASPGQVLLIREIPKVRECPEIVLEIHRTWECPGTIQGIRRTWECQSAETETDAVTEETTAAAESEVPSGYTNEIPEDYPAICPYCGAATTGTRRCEYCDCNLY